MYDPVTVEVVEPIEQLPQQCLNSVRIDCLDNLVSVMSNDFVKIVLSIIKSQIERHVDMIDVHIHELHHILVVNLPKQHDFADGGGGDAVAVLGLLELLDGDGLTPIGLDLGEENKAVCAFTDLSDQIVLLQPFRPITVTVIAVVVAAAA